MTAGGTPTSGSRSPMRSRVRSCSGARQQAGGLGAEPQKDPGFIYLVSAVGGTGGPPTGHMVIVARSRSVDGPLGESPAQPDRPHRGCVRVVVVARARDTGAGACRSVDDDWWMVSHGYENGYRTLGRQILLEPIRWGEDDWPEAAVRDLGGPLEAPVGLAAQAPEDDFADDFSRLELGRRWSFHAPGPAEAERVRSEDGLVLRGKGTSPADTSPLAMPHGRPRLRDRGRRRRRAGGRGRPAALLQQPAVLRHGDRRRADAQLFGRHPHALARTRAPRPIASRCASATTSTSSPAGIACREANGRGTRSGTRHPAITPTPSATC